MGASTEQGGENTTLVVWGQTYTSLTSVRFAQCIAALYMRRLSPF